MHGPLRVVGPHAQRFHHQAAAAQRVRKRRIVAYRPIRDNARRAQCGHRGRDAALRIESCVLRHDHAVGTVVGVEHDRIELAGMIAQHVHDIVVHHADPRILERLHRNPILGIRIPLDDLGQELRHHHFGVAGQLLERRTQREAKPETTDQHARLRRVLEAHAGDFGQPILGQMSAL